MASHVRAHAEAAGHPCLARIAQGTVCKILGRHEIKPHKVRYYLERRDEAFEAKMADVLCVYREVAILQENEVAKTNVEIISYEIPDHTTLSRRGGGLTILPKTVGREEPLHLLVDSTGLKIYG